jgi:hypothetical protein
MFFLLLKRLETEGCLRAGTRWWQARETRSCCASRKCRRKSIPCSTEPRGGGGGGEQEEEAEVEEEEALLKVAIKPPRRGRGWCRRL